MKDRRILPRMRDSRPLQGEDLEFLGFLSLLVAIPVSPGLRTWQYDPRRSSATRPSGGRAVIGKSTILLTDPVGATGRHGPGW